MTRLQLAALIHNSNVGCELATTHPGQSIVNQVFNKARKDWVIHNVYCKKKYDYLDDTLHKVLEWHMDSSVSMSDATYRVHVAGLPLNVAAKLKPSKQEALSSRQSRFCRHET
jgi:hypothetical protein